jgi:uncharacterized protein YjbI with pentapeptide repeats
MRSGPVGRKKQVRKAQPPSKRGIAWPRWTGFRGMTLRDWLPIVGALLIPVMIAAGTWGITWQQSKIEDQRAAAERELAEQRAQDEALQAYLGQMSSLLLEKDLRASEEDSEERTLARARTVTALRRLDSAHNRDVLQFLREARLAPSPKLHNLGGSKISIIRLDQTNLSEVELRGANMDSFDLAGTDLSGADLRGAYIAWSVLHETNLKDANLRGADLHGNTDLSQADLSNANLSEANLSNADLRGANLTDAVLSGAKVTDEQLAEAKSLEGATMPNGQKYEDWLGTPEGQDWLRKYEKDLGEDKKRAGVYEVWIETTEGKMWFRAVVGQDAGE